MMAGIVLRMAFLIQVPFPRSCTRNLLSFPIALLSPLLYLSTFCACSNLIPAALIDVHKDALDLSHLRGKEQVGFWTQLSVLLRRHLRSMSRDMVRLGLKHSTIV